MILVVGGAGYIGSHVNKLLHQKNLPTLVFDNLKTGHKNFVKWGNFIEGNLNNIDDIRKIFKKNKIHAVMHFAANAYVGESIVDPQKYYTNNVSNTINLLSIMLEHQCKKIIFSSSCAVYGNPVFSPMSEKHPLNPINPYGRTKLIVENILQDYQAAYDFRYVSLRYFNAAGADFDLEIGEIHQPETHLIPLVLDVALKRRDSIDIYGTHYKTYDGTAIRDYIHVVDIARAHYMALEYLNECKTSNIFNLGNGKGYSVREIIRAVEEVVGKKIKINLCNRRDGDPSILIGDFKKIKETLGWYPKVNRINSIIESAWNYHKYKFSK
tara:strand:+ start:88 stop:1062 length:975 start_codon:yes stop_codon:yes gene_type:complete